MLIPARNYAIVKKTEKRLDIMDMYTKSQIIGMVPGPDERIAVIESREVPFDHRKDAAFNKHFNFDK
jgi:hypothetical protein